MTTYRTFLACSVSACLGLFVFALAMSVATIDENSASVAAATACRTPTADYANLVAGSSYATQNEMNAACVVASRSATLTCEEPNAGYTNITAGSENRSHETRDATCGEPEAPVAHASNEPIAQTGLRPR